MEDELTALETLRWSQQADPSRAAQRCMLYKQALIDATEAVDCKFAEVRALWVQAAENEVRVLVGTQTSEHAAAQHAPQASATPTTTARAPAGVKEASCTHVSGSASVQTAAPPTEVVRAQQTTVQTLSCINKLPTFFFLSPSLTTDALRDQSSAAGIAQCQDHPLDPKNTHTSVIERDENEGEKDMESLEQTTKNRFEIRSMGQTDSRHSTEEAPHQPGSAPALPSGGREVPDLRAHTTTGEGQTAEVTALKGQVRKLDARLVEQEQEIETQDERPLVLSRGLMRSVLGRGKYAGRWGCKEFASHQIPSHLP
jgi:hypothetical protein